MVVLSQLGIRTIDARIVKIRFDHAGLEVVETDADGRTPRSTRTCGRERRQNSLILGEDEFDILVPAVAKCTNEANSVRRRFRTGS